METVATWALIIILTPVNGDIRNLDIHRYPGFASEKSCIEAGKTLVPDPKKVGAEIYCSQQ